MTASPSVLTLLPKKTAPLLLTITTGANVPLNQSFVRFGENRANFIGKHAFYFLWWKSSSKTPDYPLHCIANTYKASEFSPK